MNDAEIARRKRLGQYFTQQPVARLLAALAEAQNARSVIDPMVGRGDMLRACLDIGCRPSVLIGVDLDVDVIGQAANWMQQEPGCLLRSGDAFAIDLPSRQLDLVITNPPYIRYQSSGSLSDIAIPTAQTIRSNLLLQIDRRVELSEKAKAVFRVAAESYPGTADVAVPAWILSASLVAENGVLAIVAPQSWLSRNYASSVREMLDRAFNVELIVKDGDATWFADAQIRTHLLVAKRRPIDGLLSGRSHVVVGRATKELQRGGVLTGHLASERDVAVALRRVTSSRPVVVADGLTGHVESRPVEPGASSLRLAPEIIGKLYRSAARAPARSLESYGWRCGQGMRSGANEFFYVVGIAGHEVHTAERWRHRSVAIPTECLLPAIRRQSDLDRHTQVLATVLTSRLVNLRDWIALEDHQAALNAGVSSQWLNRRYKLLPDDVAAWIAEVAATPLHEEQPEKRIPTLSAVRTNIRKGRAGEPLACWYHLPPLAPRHRPDLFVPRVCGARPSAYVNPDRAVVDANFSTLWRAQDSALPTHAMLAILSSSWVWANFEQGCTILGGGALKVEATDFRRLALPDFDELEIDELTQLGKRLDTVDNADVLAEIDCITSRALMDTDGADELAIAVSALATEGLRHRSGGQVPDHACSACHKVKPNSAKGTAA